jgi:ArsR family transcriptional regulator
MPQYSAIAARFKVLAHPIRLQILDMLRSGDEVCVCHMEAAFKKRQAYISQQLMILRDAGLVQFRKDGLQVFYRLADDRIAVLLAFELGPAQADNLPVIDACPCPRCALVVLDEV